MTASKKQFIKQVLILTIERVGVANEVVEEEEDTVLSLLRVRHYLPHYRLLPFIVHVRLGKIEALPCVVESQRATEDENVLSEVLFVSVRLHD